jgi:hypothetical protein
MKTELIKLINKGFSVVAEDDDEIILSRKVRVIPWPICLFLGLVFLPLVLLILWKKDEVKVISK